MAEGIVLDETITFCSRYLHGCQTGFNRRTHNDDNNNESHRSELLYLTRAGRPLVGGCVSELDNTSWVQAHRYCLVNYEHIRPYIEYVILF